MNHDKKMHDMWSNISNHYGNAKDLEEKQRILLSNFLYDHRGSILELACGNGKILKKIADNNSQVKLWGIDYSEDMINIAKKTVKGVNFMLGDIRELEKNIGGKLFETVYCVNSLHNLPNPSFIYDIFNDIGNYIPTGGYFAFDIRNQWNPFIYYGYYKNRKKGLSFWTLNYFSILRCARKNGFKIRVCQGIYYKNREESGFNSRNHFINLLYSVYLKVTKAIFFAPYIFIILEKK